MTQFFYLLAINDKDAPRRNEFNSISFGIVFSREYRLLERCASSRRFLNIPLRYHGPLLHCPSYDRAIRETHPGLTRSRIIAGLDNHSAMKVRIVQAAWSLRLNLRIVVLIRPPQASALRQVYLHSIS